MGYVGKQEFWHITPLSEVPNIMRDGLLPRVGPRSQEAKETEPGIYLFPSYEAVEDALTNWLGELFPDEVELAILKILIPNDKVSQLVSRVGYEYVSLQPIPAPYIDEVLDEDGRPICQV